VEVYGERFLVLGFEHRLVIYDVEKKRGRNTLYRFGETSLNEKKLGGFLLEEDTLLVYLGGDAYKRKIDWEDLDGDYSLVDPSSWLADSALFRDYDIKSIYRMGEEWVVDSLSVFYADAGRVQLYAGEPILPIVQGIELAGEDWFLHYAELAEDDTIAPQWENDFFKWIKAENEEWLIGGSRLLRIKGAEKEELFAPGHWLINGVNHVAMDRSAGVPLVWTDKDVAYWNDSKEEFEYNQMWSISPGGELVRYVEVGYDFSDQPFYDGYAYAFSMPDNTQNAARGFKSLAVGDEGEWFLGTWGAGLLAALPVQYADSGVVHFTEYSNQHACLENYIGVMTIVTGVYSLSGDGVYFTYFGSEASAGGYGLGFYSAASGLQCYNAIGALDYAEGVFARKHGEGVKVYVSYSGAMEGAEGAWVDVWQSLTTEDQTKSFVLLATLDASEVGLVKDFAEDSYGNLWMMSHTSLGVVRSDTLYYESGERMVRDTIVAFAKGNQPEAAEFRAIEQGVDGEMWLATLRDGVFLMKFDELPWVNGMKWENFDVRDGMLDMDVYDMALNRANGELWLGHPQGLSRFYTTSRSTPAEQGDFSELKVYPNPWIGGTHDKIVFDGLDAEGVLRIFDAGGYEVRRFQGDEIRGGYLEWGLDNASGQVLKAGVYYYQVENRQAKTKMEKLLILR
jgi:hypothetical protein